jgi:hypothetical protein
MTINQEFGRIEQSASHSVNREPLEDRTVLRLSRESLRAEQPAVRFVSKIEPASWRQRMLWQA